MEEPSMKLKIETPTLASIIGLVVCWALLIFSLGFSVWATVHSSATKGVGTFSYFIVALVLALIAIALYTD